MGPVDLPRVMQAPIGPATMPDLVAAVAAAGGLGTLAGSWTAPGVLREQVAELQRRLEQPFCVNLVLAFDQRERLELLAEMRVPVVSFSWGVDQAVFERAKAGGIAVLVQVGNLESGMLAASLGADGLIAQGIEAGGHVQSRLLVGELVRGRREHLRLPLIAAGGIADARAVNAALSAGADGIAAGSVYLAAAEADVHPTYRQLVLDSSGSDTLITELFDVGWPSAPHRTLRNQTVEAWMAAGRPPSGERPGEGDEIAWRDGRAILRYSDAQPTRTTTGDIPAMALYAGLGIDSITEPGDAAAITERLAAAATENRPAQTN